MSKFCIEHDDKNGKNFSDYLSIVRFPFFSSVRECVNACLEISVFFVQQHMITFHRNLPINIRCQCDAAVRIVGWLLTSRMIDTWKIQAATRECFA